MPQLRSVNPSGHPRHYMHLPECKVGGCTGWGGVGDSGGRCGLPDRVRDGSAAVHQLLLQWRAAAVLPQVRQRPRDLRFSDCALLRGQPELAGGCVI